MTPTLLATATRQATVWQVHLLARLLALWDLGELLDADDTAHCLTKAERRLLEAARPLWEVGRGEKARGP